MMTVMISIGDVIHPNSQVMTSKLYANYTSSPLLPRFIPKWINLFHIFVWKQNVQNARNEAVMVS